ncbi:hypothetical protein ARMGADRAFT_1040478 [Armillaria gallica]|uniref:Uncharacterized protein n=1 Tax=Armillaria gallica TaxID=47427 RepID=A0A2H3CD86_ARMGA|nr:hypothetical protein ARMGADRAFT_1040478 [Armillaria gallica]
MAPTFTSTTKLSHEDGLLLLVAHAHNAGLHDAVKSLAVSADGTAKVQDWAASVRVADGVVTVIAGTKVFKSKPLSGDIKDVFAVGTLFFRAEATSVLDGDNEIWYQQYPSYETGQVADGRVVIDFWTDDKIVAVFKSNVDNDYGSWGQGTWKNMVPGGPTKP